MQLSNATLIPCTFTRAAFPLGGIGTGNVSLGARGEFRDWEIRGRAAKGTVNPYSFFAISAEPEDGQRVTRILESRHAGPRDWPTGGDWSLLAGLPRLRSSTMRGEYPFVEIDFDDDTLPVDVTLSAFTPLIPLDSADSGIPGAILRYRVTNRAPTRTSVTVAGSLSHVAGASLVELDGRYDARQTVSWREGDGIRGLDFGVEYDASDVRYGTMSLATTDTSVVAMPEWPKNGSTRFWETFRTDGRLSPATPDPLDDVVPTWLVAAGYDSWPEEFLPKRRTGSLGILHDLDPGESRDFEFVLSWSFPNRVRGWEDEVGIFVRDEAAPDPGAIRNFYATRWHDSWAAAAYLLTELPRLELATTAFHDALYSSDLDPAVLDAVSATIVAVRSTTCFRYEDGNFFAWEGNYDHRGSCSGTCTHVWSYAQTVAWLFPDLERSARRMEYLVETESNGRQHFRAHQYFGGKPFAWPAAVDGQLGTLVRLHREWRFSGDDDFLRELWPVAKLTLDYAMREWDQDDDGVLDALMHNTYDIEFDGSEPLSNILLLAALRAASRMAAAVGDAESSTRYLEAFARSAPRIDEMLYNGEYYEQHVHDVNARPNQYGTGVLADQLLGQFQAHLNGFGFLLPKEHVKTAINSVYVHNFRPDLTRHESLARAYAVDDEGGLLLATWPRGGRPHRAFVYSDEVWSGIEYLVATELVYNGLIDAALEIVRTVRARHSGQHRSPWDEIEAGHHYARSMSAWGLVLAFSGAQYDAPARTLSFEPVVDGRYFFSTGSGWGTAEVRGAAVTIRLDFGVLSIDSLRVRGNDLGPVSLSAGANFDA
jgi:non-lysosomal glucosylceramidase